MTLILDLPPNLEARINSEAERRGVPFTECVLEMLEAAATSEPQPTAEEKSTTRSPHPPNTAAKTARGPLTGAQIVARWRARGLIGTRPEIDDSVAFVQEMRRRAVTRDWT
jgi:hypothetical protein